MALKALLLRNKINALRRSLEELESRDPEFATRETDLEASIAAAQTDEERTAVEAEVDQFVADQDQHEAERTRLTNEIEQLERELQEEEQRTAVPTSTPTHAPAAAPTPTPVPNQRKDVYTMPHMATRGFNAMTAEQRSAFAQREDVADFLTRFRNAFTGPGAQQRAVTGAELMIPDVVLGLIRENIEDYSKLIRRVHFVQVSGTARQPIMGTIPEAVWTEMCATLNELNFGLNEVEVDGYKVGGYVSVCNARLKDSVGLLADLIEGIGAAIGKALDKAILYGTGVKMPLGIASRLAQAAKPDNYPINAPTWQDLHTSNVITISAANATGIKLFQGLAQAAGKAKGNYSRGDKFWAMNEATYTNLKVEAMTINAAGAIVSSMEGTMPVIGGDVVVFGDTVMPDNTILGGYGDLYLLVERDGTVVGYSDLPMYIQDQTVVKGTARYDGTPVIAEGFVAIGVGAAPTMTMAFAPDTANAAAAANSGAAG